MAVLNCGGYWEFRLWLAWILTVPLRHFLGVFSYVYHTSLPPRAPDSSQGQVVEQGNHEAWPSKILVDGS